MANEEILETSVCKRTGRTRVGTKKLKIEWALAYII
jgi:hypothetical protein